MNTTLNTTTNTMNNITTTNTTPMYNSRELAIAVHCPGNEIGGIITKAGVQPLHVRVSKTGKHYYTWGQDAMDVALAWRVEQDKRLAAKADKRAAKKPAPKQLELQLPQPDVTETFPTIERRKDDAQLIAIHEQLVALNNNMLALLACWTKE